MPPTEDELRAQIARLGAELDRRLGTVRNLDNIYEGRHPVPRAVSQAKATNAYRMLMDLSQSNWPKLVVDSVEERLEVQGMRFGEDASDDVWDIWQENCLDADSGLVHQATLATGRAYAIVWAGPDGRPKITPEHAETTIVEYAPGTRRTRLAALRRWMEEDETWAATLYRPEGIYKFKADKSPTTPAADKWMRRDVDGEAWPLANPLAVVPVVEFAVNRTLRPAPFGSGSGEFAGDLGHIDRINYTIFSGLVAMTWSGFPIRALIGDPILRDDDGNPLKPFDVAADKLVQVENPDGKLVQLPESDLDNYFKAAETHIKHFAAITKTPAHYLLGELVNLSADAIRAAEAALIAKTRRHQRSLGESWEEVLRLALRVVDPEDARASDPSGETIWRDPENRSRAEAADAAVKLNGILPRQLLWSKFLGLSPQEIAQADADAAFAEAVAPPDVAAA